MEFSVEFQAKPFASELLRTLAAMTKFGDSGYS
jgi:hypothetical protein